MLIQDAPEINDGKWHSIVADGLLFWIRRVRENVYEKSFVEPME